MYIPRYLGRYSNIYITYTTLPFLYSLEHTKATVFRSIYHFPPLGLFARDSETILMERHIPAQLVHLLSYLSSEATVSCRVQDRNLPRARHPRFQELYIIPDRGH